MSIPKDSKEFAVIQRIFADFHHHPGAAKQSFGALLEAVRILAIGDSESTTGDGLAGAFVALGELAASNAFLAPTDFERGAFGDARLNEIVAGISRLPHKADGEGLAIEATTLILASFAYLAGRSDLGISEDESGLLVEQLVIAAASVLEHAAWKCGGWGAE